MRSAGSIFYRFAVLLLGHAHSGSMIVILSCLITGSKLVLEEKKYTLKQMGCSDKVTKWEKLSVNIWLFEYWNRIAGQDLKAENKDNTFTLVQRLFSVEAQRS